MKKQIRIISFLCIILITMGATKCSPDLDEINKEQIIDKIETDNYGMQVCRRYSSIFDSLNPLSIGSYCPETRSYNEQVINIDEDRFDKTNYTTADNNSNSLVGNWMMLYESNQFGWLRESCDLTVSSDDIDTLLLKCEEVHQSFSQMVHDTVTNSLAVSSTVRYGTTDDAAADRYSTTYTTTGQITNMNRIDISTQIVTEYLDIAPDRVESTEHQFTLVRLGNIGHTLGTLSVEKFDFERNLLLMEEYDVAYFLEKSDNIKLLTHNGEVLATLPSNVVLENTTKLSPKPFSLSLYGNRYKTNYFPGVSIDLFDSEGLDPTFNSTSDIGNFLLIRQFDYLKNNANNMELDFLISRTQATRFERGDTIGKLRLSF